MQRDRKYLQAHEVLEAIFERQIEFENIDEELARIDHRSAREILVRSLRQGIDVGETPLFEMIFEKIGIGQSQDDLLGIVNDPDKPIRVRAAAFSIIVGSGLTPAEIQPKLKNVTMFQLLAGRLRDAALATLIDEGHTASVAAILASVPETMRPALLSDLDSARRESSIPAPLLYRDAAGKLDPASEATIFAAIADDAHPAGIPLLEKVIAGIVEYGLAAKAAEAIVELKRRIAGGTRRVPEGRAFLLPVFDGYSAAQLELATPSGASIFASFVMSGGTIEHCVVEIDEAGERERQVPEHAGETDLGTAAAIMTRRPAPDSLRGASAIAILQTIEPRQIAMPAPAPGCSREDLARVFAGEGYEGWRLLPEEFDARDISPPDNWEPTEEWLRESARRLADSDVKKRLVSDAGYMSIWHMVRGEAEAAALMSRCARDMDESFEQSVLLTETLRLSVENARRAFENGTAAGEDDDDGVDYDEYAAFAESMEPFVGKIEQQLQSNEPPVTRETYEKLVNGGMPGDEVTRVLALLLRSEMTVSEAAGRDFDAERWARRLAMLPDIDAAIDHVP